jgi:putative hydrolase of HD superfamily
VPSERLQRQIGFLLEADKLKAILRRTPLIDNSRQENSAEHSWHLTLAAVTLAEYAPAGTDLLHALRLLIVHDLVEIDAGDTFAYDEGEGAATKDVREAAAADRLYGLLPAPAGARLRDMWESYERGDSPEALLVMAVDRLAPVLLNLTEGGTTWREHGITYDRVVARNGPHIEPVFPDAWAEVLVRLDAAVADGRLLRA